MYWYCLLLFDVLILFVNVWCPCSGARHNVLILFVNVWCPCSRARHDVLILFDARVVDARVVDARVVDDVLILFVNVWCPCSRARHNVLILFINVWCPCSRSRHDVLILFVNVWCPCRRARHNVLIPFVNFYFIELHLNKLYIISTIAQYKTLCYVILCIFATIMYIPRTGVGGLDKHNRCKLCIVLVYVYQDNCHWLNSWKNDITFYIHIRCI